MKRNGNKERSLMKICATWLPACLLVCAAISPRPASAQNPGLNTGKRENIIPVSGEKPAASKTVARAVSKEQIIRDLVLTGELKAARSTMINAPNIRSSFSNTITFLAPEGSFVKKGERIVEFDDSSLQSQKSEAERTLDEAKLNIEKKKVDLEADRTDQLNSLNQAESTLKQDELYGKISKDLLPGNTYQKYQLNVTKSKLSVQKAKEQLDNFEKSYASQMALVEINRSQAEINLKKIESDMQLLKIDAPQDGILIYGDNWTSNRKIQPGDSVPQGMEVASLPDLSSLQVIGYVYDTEYSQLAPAMRCSVTLDALPGFAVDGKILSLTSVASRKGFATTKKVFQTVVQLDKVDPAVMKPGMTARVRVPLLLAKDVAAVPREYLGIDSQGRYFVLKKSPDAKDAVTQVVTVGEIGDRFVQVVNGVSVGDLLMPAQRTAEVSK
jgi:multidrug efflux pump subunit AcrA (membrane-fusion protein)